MAKIGLYGFVSSLFVFLGIIPGIVYLSLLLSGQSGGQVVSLLILYYLVVLVAGFIFVLRWLEREIS